MLRAVAVWRTLFLQRFPLDRHPERSRRIHLAIAEKGRTDTKGLRAFSVARAAAEAAGVYRAIAGRSFDYAQDDETGMALEAVGEYRASAGGSFDYAQDDETGAAEEAVGVLRAVAVWRTLLLKRFPLIRHPERSRRIQQH